MNPRFLLSHWNGVILMMGGGFFMIFLWMAPILLVALAAKWYLDGRQKDREASDTPLDILVRRYANGPSILFVDRGDVFGLTA